MGDQEIIWLNHAAPSKPQLGAPCNGCGVCCAVRPCPVAMLFLRQRRGMCKALEWQSDIAQYRCGMLRNPQRYLRFLPHPFTPIFRSLIKRWIAADTSCDSSATIESSPKI